MNKAIPLEIETEYYSGSLIKVYVGDNAEIGFLSAMQATRYDFNTPAYIAPPRIDHMICGWWAAQGKNVLIIGKIPEIEVIKFMELLIIFGAWSVVGIDTDGGIHLQNADIYRSNGFKMRTKR